MTIWSGVRTLKMDKKYLSEMERHGKRLDNSRDRVDLKKTKFSYKCSDYSDVSSSLNLMENFKKVEDSGVKTYGKSSIGLHMILSISSDWMKETGDIHDPKNPRNKQAMIEARNFIHDKFGEKSILGMRMDFDESGGGNIDVFVIPLHEVKQRNTIKTVISPSKSLSQLKKKYGKKGDMEYEVLQDLWNNHCKKNIDKSIKRGIPKTETNIENVSHRVYNKVIDSVKDDLEGSKLKKFITNMNTVKEMITDETKNEINKQVKESNDKLKQQHVKEKRELTKRLETIEKTVVLQSKQLKETILENNRLEDKIDNLNTTILEQNKKFDMIKDGLRMVKDLPNNIRKLLGLETQYKGLTGQKNWSKGLDI